MPLSRVITISGLIESLVEFVLGERRERKVAPPKQLSVHGVQAEHVQAAGVVSGARQKDAVAPQHGR